MRKRWALTAMATVLALSLVGDRGASAQTAMGTGAPRLDLQVIAFPLPTGDWGVSAVYPTRVPRAQVEAREKMLTALTKWPVHDVLYEERAVDVGWQGDPTADLSRVGVRSSKDRVMSSITFTTSANVVDLRAGTVDLSPWIEAYRDLSNLHLTFMLPPQLKVTYHGLRHYEDDKVVADLVSPDTGALTYIVQIKDHQLTHLSLPLVQEATDTKAAQDRSRSLRASQQKRVVGMALVVLLALGAGGLVYVWATRLGSGTQKSDSVP